MAKYDEAAVVAVVSDLHTNSTVGLCPPYVDLDDGGKYRPSDAQRWLWRHWKVYIDKVKQQLERENGRLIIIINGDMFDGDHHGTPQIITRNEATQQRIAYEALEPLLTVWDPERTKIVMIRGTESHVGSAASREETLAQDIGADPIKNQKGEVLSYSWWHARPKINGVRFDLAHHGNIGSLAWTKYNAANKLAISTMLKYQGAGEKPPHLVIRSHKHTFGDSGNNYPTRALFTGAWQLMTAFGYKVVPDVLAEIGGYIIPIDRSGDHYVERYKVQPDLVKETDL